MNFKPLFEPKSIAIVGASTETGSVGNDIAKNILFGGYSGTVFLVNPKTTTLFNRECFPNIQSLPNAPELSIIIVPAKIVPTVLRESGEKGVRAAVIISAGFRETGPEGATLEEEVISIAKTFDITLLGPNCLGFLNPSLKLNASFAADKLFPKAGSIAFFSQSGALSTALLDLGKHELGFSVFASVGNKALLREADFLSFAKDDPKTHIIALYSETIENAMTFIESVRALDSLPHPKPVIILKSGTTEAGASASSSHTGALAGSDTAYEALFRSAGALRAKNVNHLKSLLSVFSNNPFPKGRRIAVITNAGGLGVLATDAIVTSGLALAELSAETKARLSEFLPKAASTANPIDVLGDAKSDRYAKTLDIVSADPNVDMLAVIVTPQSMTEPSETASALIHTHSTSKKPLVAIFSGKDALEIGRSKLVSAGVSTFTYPEEAILALADFTAFALRDRKKSHTNSDSLPGIDTDAARDIIGSVHTFGRTHLSESEGYKLLSLYGFPTLRSYEVGSASEAQAAAGMVGGLVAMKINSPDILHKSDVGGVLLDIKPEKSGDAYEKLLRIVGKNVPTAKLAGAVIVEMAKEGGTELILGIKKEPGLGTLLMVGLGGIFVEVFKDASFRFAPVSHSEALEMLRELRAFPILEGTRGKSGIHLDAVADAIVRLSQLVSDFPEISEIDINPLLAFPNPKDFRILDARILLK